MSASQSDAAPPGKGRRIKHWVSDKAGLLLVLVAGVTVASYLGRLHFLLELCTHFRVFYLIAAVSLTALLVALKAWRWAILGAVLVALNSASVLPCYWPVERPAAAPNLRILQANVLTANRRCELLLSRIHQYRPDVIVLVEVDKFWLKALAGLSQDYPYAVRQPRPDNFGIALFSRFPIHDMRVFRLADTEASAITARVALGDREVTCLAVHAFPPGSAKLAHTRDVQLRGAAEIARSTRGPIVVCGDFNATQWSPIFKDTLAESQLKDARGGFGVGGTWPTQYAPFLIPLDQCLVSRAIQVKSFKVLADIGSDHLPVLVEMVVPDFPGIPTGGGPLLH